MNKLYNLFSKYLSKTRIKGKLFRKPEDFIVREVSKEGLLANEKLRKKALTGDKKKHVKLVLTKKGLSTIEAIKNLAKTLQIPEEAVSYSGLKDTFGVTSQWISIPSNLILPKIDALFNADIPQVSLSNPFYSDNPCEIRQINGNYFEIRVRNFVKSKDNLSLLENYQKILQNQHFPNFYGPQRFGKKQNGHRVGKHILKKEFDKAVKEFCLTNNRDENPQNKKLRSKIRENWGLWEKCHEISIKSREFYNESRIFNHLKDNPSDYAGALSKTGLTKLFISSFSSHLFNNILLKAYQNHDYTRIPLIGADIKLGNDFLGKEYKKLIKKEGVDILNFRSNDAELNFSGRQKEAFYKVKDFQYYFTDDGLLLTFELPMGVYASLFLESLIKVDSGRFKLE